MVINFTGKRRIKDETEVKEVPTHYEVDLRANRLMVYRYEIISARGAYLCKPYIHACILPQNGLTHHKVLKQVMPPKFYFDNFCTHDPGIAETYYEVGRVLDDYCQAEVEIDVDERLFDIPEHPGFTKTAASLLVDKTIISRNTLMIVPDYWMTGLCRRFRRISKEIQKYDNTINNWSVYERKIRDWIV